MHTVLFYPFNRHSKPWCHAFFEDVVGNLDIVFKFINHGINCILVQYHSFKKISTSGMYDTMDTYLEIEVDFKWGHG